ncbi:quinoprotein glucose dehydrogenase [Virgibacillus profundi]|uniref:Quinoprotein glucose dehydrogenase n=2 Tax=Virgibacillus profundi TaxID=2024555 RepID=A0A2A2IG77_9BACI|nr:quinoprotein glucose dehydrogenase [Virgibacillus profundi]PXY54829.1 quinoprotein glucose dehydrogenase [Virgibacillus profundi]
MLLLIVFATACSNTTDQETEQDNGDENTEEGKSEKDENRTADDSGNEKGANNESEETSKTKEPDVMNERKVIAKKLEQPWEIAFVDDTFYISERTGSIVTIQNEELIRKPVEFNQNLSSQPEAGLLGIAIPDDFKETNTAFAYYSYQEDEQFFQRVVTIEEADDSWIETSILLDEIPGGQYHQGGRIEIGPDGKLYITTGDAVMPELAQDLDSLAGKILRMNLDGTMPDDNPFNDSYVYSYGHRNPQGLAWGPENEFYATEHGSNAYDEVNHIKPGNNYGWPVIRGDETAENMKIPVVHSGEDTWAPSGMTYYRGNFYFASLRGEGLRKFDPMNETVELIVSDVGRVRDVYAAEAGLYLITNNTDGRGEPAVDDDKLIFIPIPKNQLH